MSNPDEIPRLAADLVAKLPPGQVRSLAVALAQRATAGTPVSPAEVLESLPQPEARKAVGEFLDAWRSRAPTMAAESVAAALCAAAWTAERFGKESVTELVWTGVGTGTIPLRRTEQVLLELVESAHERLLFVSYAVYRARTLGEALLRAVNRGVLLTLVLEPSDLEEGDSVSKALGALHPQLAQKAEVLVWPAEKRMRDEHGHAGVLHAKCAVADGKLLFLSSAHLTEPALTVNMELGVLIRGGPLPNRIVEHFDSLRQAGVLAPKVVM